ncbi:DUF2931 family protein [Sulfuricurvum sp.]|uniref:DUF2931 family protein n=1 Tax=Sulfuricurvum sp. TaxID=2025608 RepID=UPI002D2BDF6F|nr:DUF2931 family protein [Sulfuricurvum sp.]HZF71547.1 DUF2931 family protein [Sulfuricurvum sp.]
MDAKKSVELHTALSSPEGYPVLMVQGYNAYRDEDGFPIGGFFSNVTMQGWDTPNGVAGGRMDKFPHHVHLRWLSVAENQFYELNADLPVEKIRKLYEQGYRAHANNTAFNVKTGEYKPLDGICFLMAPGGGVQVNMIGGEGREIAFYKAKKIDMPWHEYHNVPKGKEGSREEDIKYLTSEKFIDNPMAYDQIKNHKIPYGLWDEVYRLRYPWHVEILNPIAYKQYYVEYVNAESFLVWEDQIEQDKAKPDRPVPSHFGIYFTNSAGERLVGLLKFDVLKTPELFKEFFKDSHEHARLEIKVSDDLQHVEVKLKDSHRSVIVPHRIWKVKPVAGNSGWGFDTRG